MPRTTVRLAAASGAVAVALLLSGCDALMGGQDNPFVAETTAPPLATPAPVPTATCANYPVDSVFSAYGTVHYTQELADNLTLDFDMFTEQKTHEWYADTNKALQFTVNVEDTASGLTRDSKFTDRRAVYMTKFDIDATTITPTGTGASVLSESLTPRDETLDPEALHKGDGLLITSPKGGFQRQDDTVIGSVPVETIGLNLTFDMTLKVQHSKGSKTYDEGDYKVEIPVAIFNDTTKDDSTSCATSSTLAPVTTN